MGFSRLVESGVGEENVDTISQKTKDNKVSEVDEEKLDAEIDRLGYEGTIVLFCGDCFSFVQTFVDLLIFSEEMLEKKQQLIMLEVRNNL